MPEGDTIYRAAEALNRALAGHAVERFESVFPALTRIHEDTPITGRIIERVRALGKHLLIHFSGGHVLRTHMRMNGSWHIYRAGERWRRSRRDMRIVVATRQYEAVGFNIPVAELVPTKDLARHAPLRALGPDLLADDFDRAEAIRRIRGRQATSVAEVLLDQRVVAGIGNVYKSEVLFACGIHPFRPVTRLSDAQVECLIDTARRFLRLNVTRTLRPMTTYGGYGRTTRRDAPAERLWVYGRRGAPCRRCGSAIVATKDGTSARLTYWCPACQPEQRDGGSTE